MIDQRPVNPPIPGEMADERTTKILIDSRTLFARLATELCLANGRGPEIREA